MLPLLDLTHERSLDHVGVALRQVLHPLGLADVAVIISFLVPIGGYRLGFLRALRVLRLFRSYLIVSRMKRDFPFVRRNYDTIVAGTNLFVFLFGMTAVVYETQHRYNRLER